MCVCVCVSQVAEAAPELKQVLALKLNLLRFAGGAMFVDEKVKEQ